MKKIIVFILLSAFIISAPAAVHAENAGPGSSAAVTLGDAMRALKYTAHKGDLTFTEKQTWDIDNDGKIGLTDVMKIFMAACGQIRTAETGTLYTARLYYIDILHRISTDPR